MCLGGLGKIKEPSLSFITNACQNHHTRKGDTLFITFTCYKWLPLIELTNSHDVVYKWFDYLKTKGHLVTGM